jgi:hypothetical protein
MLPGQQQALRDAQAAEELALRRYQAAAGGAR